MAEKEQLVPSSWSIILIHYLSLAKVHLLTWNMLSKDQCQQRPTGLSALATFCTS